MQGGPGTFLPVFMLRGYVTRHGFLPGTSRFPVDEIGTRVRRLVRAAIRENGRHWQTAEGILQLGGVGVEQVRQAVAQKYPGVTATERQVGQALLKVQLEDRLHRLEIFHKKHGHAFAVEGACNDPLVNAFLRLILGFEVKTSSARRAQWLRKVLMDVYARAQELQVLPAPMSYRRLVRFMRFVERVREGVQARGHLSCRDPDERSLVVMASRLRKRYAKQPLDPRLYTILKEAGFPFKPMSQKKCGRLAHTPEIHQRHRQLLRQYRLDRWETIFHKVVRAASRQGHYRFPNGSVSKNWCAHTRLAYRNGQLTAAQLRNLLKVGFPLQTNVGRPRKDT